MNSREVWEREYASGHWERIETAPEFGRYALISAHVARKGGQPRVLDVGCGTGRLLTLIDGMDRGEYLGLDLSAEALERARALKIERAEFEVAWAEQFETERRFDVIVFNEVLYYLPNTEQVIERYKRFLAPGGMIIISMFRCFPARRIWRKLERAYSFTHQEQVTNHLGQSWDVRVL